MPKGLRVRFPYLAQSGYQVSGFVKLAMSKGGPPVLSLRSSGEGLKDVEPFGRDFDCRNRVRRIDRKTDMMGLRSMAGRRTLTPLIRVRSPEAQPAQASCNDPPKPVDLGASASN